MVNRVQQREEGGGVRHRRQEEAGPCTLLHSSRVIYLIVFLSTQPAVQLGRLQHKRGWRSVKPPHQQKPNKSGRWSRVCYLFCKTLTQHFSYLTSSRYRHALIVFHIFQHVAVRLHRGLNLKCIWCIPVLVSSLCHYNECWSRFSSASHQSCCYDVIDFQCGKNKQKRVGVRVGGLHVVVVRVMGLGFGVMMFLGCLNHLQVRGWTDWSKCRRYRYQHRYWY